MAISINNVQTSTTNTLSYTPSNVADACLVVLISSEDVSDNQPITGVDFGATPMVLGVYNDTGGISGSNANDSAGYYLLSPGTSAQTITVNGGERHGIIALTLSGVGGLDSTGFNASPVSGSAVSTTTTTGSAFLVSTASHESNVDVSISTSDATVFQYHLPFSTNHAAAWSSETTAGTYSHSWSGPSGRFSSAVMAFSETGAPTVDNLLADNLQSLSTVSTPAITQTHVLLADNLQSLSTLSTPALTSGSTTDVLLADDLQSLSTVSTPAIGQAHILLADNLQSLSTVSTPAIGQIHGITADDLSSTSTLSTPTIGQIHVLLADDLQSLSRLSTPTLNRPSIATPTIRTLTVGAESRILAQSAEIRLSTIAAESRTTTL